jgi:hypothetical protein
MTSFPSKCSTLSGIGARGQPSSHCDSSLKGKDARDVIHVKATPFLLFEVVLVLVGTSDVVELQVEGDLSDDEEGASERARGGPQREIGRNLCFDSRQVSFRYLTKRALWTSCEQSQSTVNRLALSKSRADPQPHLPSLATNMSADTQTPPVATTAVPLKAKAPAAEKPVEDKALSNDVCVSRIFRTALSRSSDGRWC